MLFGHQDNTTTMPTGQVAEPDRTQSGSQTIPDSTLTTANNAATPASTTPSDTAVTPRRIKHPNI
ncbi:hypothetical protein IPL68_03080 [Candidatus Saccharibacteria bacterium]|nr:MAG: hypothetical protein IPL68_03080 [Candidatus Saccharibacteria bacterium]